MMDEAGDPLDTLIKAVIEAIVEAYDDAFIDLEAANTRVRALGVNVQLAEREACAKHIDVPLTASGHEFAAAIRARGESSTAATAPASGE